MHAFVCGAGLCRACCELGRWALVAAAPNACHGQRGLRDPPPRTLGQPVTNAARVGLTVTWLTQKQGTISA
jgi:hypothetical protein